MLSRNIKLGVTQLGQSARLGREMSEVRILPPREVYELIAAQRLQ